MRSLTVGATEQMTSAGGPSAADPLTRCLDAIKSLRPLFSFVQGGEQFAENKDAAKQLQALGIPLTDKPELHFLANRTVILALVGC